MTVTTTTRRNDADGNGVTTTFPYTFRILAVEDLTVILRNAAGVETTLAYPADYTVTGVGRSTGGNVILAVAPANGEHLVNLRQLTIGQPVNLNTTGDGFLPETIEEALDRGAMVDLQLDERLGRSLQLSESEVGDDDLITLPLDRANMLLAFDADKKPIAISVDSIATGGGGGGGGGGYGGVVSPFAATLLDDTSAGQMRSTLGVITVTELNAAVAQEVADREDAIDAVNLAWAAAVQAEEDARGVSELLLTEQQIAGDIATLAAADIESEYLAKRWGVVTVADASDRDTQFPSPTTNLDYTQLIYRADTRRIQAWTGTSWQDLADTVGVISGGGGGGGTLDELALYQPASPPDDSIDESITLSADPFDNDGFSWFTEFIVNDSKVGAISGNNEVHGMITNSTGDDPSYGFRSHDPADLDDPIWVWVNDVPFGRSDFPWDVPFPVYSVDFGIGDKIRVNAQFDKTGPITMEVSVNENPPSVHLRDYGSTLPSPSGLGLHINSINGSHQNANGHNVDLITDGLNDMAAALTHLGLGSSAGSGVSVEDLADAISTVTIVAEDYTDAAGLTLTEQIIAGDIATLAAADIGSETFALKYGHVVVLDNAARDALFTAPVAWESRVYNRAAGAGQIYDGASWQTEYTNSGSSEPAPTRVDIRKYGAQSGNGFDNYAAITAAYAATPDNGKLYIPYGQWETRRTIIFNRPVSIEGDGPASCIFLKLFNVDTKFGVVFGTPFGMGIGGLNWDERGVKTSGCTFRDFSVQGSNDTGCLYAAFISHCHRCTFDNVHIYGSAYNAVIVMGCLQSRFRLIGNLNGPPNTYQDKVVLKGTVGSVPSGNGIVVGTTTVGPSPMVANNQLYYRRVLRTQVTAVGNDNFLTDTSRDIRISDGSANGATFINTGTTIRGYNTWSAYSVTPPAAGARFAIINDGSTGWKGAFMLMKNPRTAPKGFTDAEWGYLVWQAANGGKSPMPCNANKFDINAEGGTVTGGIWGEAQPASGGNNSFTGTLQGFLAKTVGGTSTLPGELGNGYGISLTDNIGFHWTELHVENTALGSQIVKVGSGDTNVRQFSIDNSKFVGSVANTERLHVNAASATDFGYSIRNCEIHRYTIAGHTSGSVTEDRCIVGVRV